jgi:hypothetical protein
MGNITKLLTYFPVAEVEVMSIEDECFSLPVVWSLHIRNILISVHSRHTTRADFHLEYFSSSPYVHSIQPEVIFSFLPPLVSWRVRTVIRILLVCIAHISGGKGE